jgi:hypothetical protein
MAGEQLDREEQLIWRILAKLETLALQKYEKAAPQLAIPAKKEIVQTLQRGAPDDRALDASPLARPVNDLLDAASVPDEADTLIVQGFLLERLGQIIYKALSTQAAVSASTRSVGVAGLNACASVIGLATERLRKVVGEGEVLFEVFSTASDGVLRRLDGLGEGVDQLFGQRFGLTFSEVLGDFTAELLPACVELGMNRRKLVCHLAGVFMGM